MVAKFRVESSRGSWQRLNQAERCMVKCAGLLGCMVILASGLSACSSKSGAPTPVLVGDASADRPADASVRVTISGNDCPTVTVTAGPAIARVGDRVAVSANGADDDGADRLTYAWSAAAGSFTSPTNPTTTYTCPSANQAGPQILTVAVSDGKCSVTRSVTVTCDVFVPAGDASTDSSDAKDGGADGGVGGAGGTGSGGTSGGAGGMAGGTGGAGGACTSSFPSDCEGIACNQCTFGVGPGETDMCSGTPADCGNCDPTTMGCQLLQSDAARTKCNALYVCLRDTHCLVNSNPLPCYCGDANPDVCSMPSFTGTRNGACIQQIIAAAGTSDVPTIIANIVNPNIALGAATNLAICRSTFCGKIANPAAPPCSSW